MIITDLCDDILSIIEDKVKYNRHYRYKRVIDELEGIISKTQVFIPEKGMGTDEEHHPGNPRLAICFHEGEEVDYDIDDVQYYDPIEDWMDRSITRKWGWKSVDLLKRWYSDDLFECYHREISYFVVDWDEYMLGSRWYEDLKYTYPNRYFLTIDDNMFWN